MAAAQADTHVILSELALEQSWLKLVHYEADSSSPGGWRSAIHSDEFFLNADGRVNPLLELQATLDAFVAASEADPNQHAQCRFPARWQWLKGRLGDTYPGLESAIKCPEFEAWTRSGSVASLSIVFATGYLGNPASYYGHTLIKFNFKGGEGRTQLMDVSVNYGAIVEKNDGPFTYIIKSLAGGYDGGFSHTHYYNFNHNYGENELRDLWEYKLDLPEAAVDLVVAHAWEVLGKRYTYGFFRQNCAYRMAEVFQVVDGLEIVPDNYPWVIPQAVIERLGAASYRGKPLLADVTYLPSRQSRFYDKYLNLSQQESSLLKELIDGKRSLDEQAFQRLPTPSRQALLDAMLDYYQFVGAPLENAPKNIRQAYTKVLAARYQLEAGSPDPRPIQHVSPHLGRPIGWLQAGWGYNSVSGNALSIRFRPAYYDVLDTDSGQVPNSALIMGDTQLNILHGRASIYKVDLIGVESVNPGLTGLAGDNGAAWKLHIGAVQQRLSCDDCMVARVQGDMGLGRQWYGNFFSAIYVGGAIQNNRGEQGFGFARTSLNMILKQSERFGVRLNYEQRFPAGSKLESYGVTELEARWLIDSRSDFRIKYEHDIAELIGMGIGMYW